MAPAPPEMEHADWNMSDLEEELAELRDQAEMEVGAATRRLWSHRIAGLLNLLVALLTLASRRAMTVGGRQEGTDAAYDRLMRWGRWLGRPLAPADTPRTYAAGIIAAAERIVADRRRTRPRLAQAEAVVRVEVPRLTETFEAMLYAGETVAEAAKPKEPTRYAALWSALRRLWLARWRI